MIDKDYILVHKDLYAELVANKPTYKGIDVHSLFTQLSESAREMDKLRCIIAEKDARIEKLNHLITDKEIERFPSMPVLNTELIDKEPQEPKGTITYVNEIPEDIVSRFRLVLSYHKKCSPHIVEAPVYHLWGDWYCSRANMTGEYCGDDNIVFFSDKMATILTYGYLRSKTPDELLKELN